MKSQKTISQKVVFSLLIIFCLGLNTNILYSQTTAIPDTDFEQALIDFGIDSDGVINGQVLTSDINSIITLILLDEEIHDLTGIEDFTALEILDVSYNNLTILDVSNNIQLKELYASNSDGGNNDISSLDLSNNINLELLYCGSLFPLGSVNLKNGNNSILNVRILCQVEGEACELPELDCIIVDDEEAATNNEPPYSNWIVQADFIYSEDCSLSVSSNNDRFFSVYPNPVKDQLNISSSKNESDNLKVTIFTIEGKILYTQNLIIDKQATINVSNFLKGLYFISLQNENGQREVVKFVKE